MEWQNAMHDLRFILKSSVGMNRMSERAGASWASVLQLWLVLASAGKKR